MKFNRREIRRIRQALYEATNSIEALIDAHRNNLVMRKGSVIRTFDKRDANQLAVWRRQIAAWHKILCKLREPHPTE